MGSEGIEAAAVVVVLAAAASDPPGRWVTDNGNIPERVLVVGDVPGKDAKTGDSEKPCIERSKAVCASNAPKTRKLET